MALTASLHVKGRSTGFSQTNLKITGGSPRCTEHPGEILLALIPDS